MKKLLLLVVTLACAMPASAAAPPRILASQDVDPLWSPDGRRIAFTRIYAYRDALEVLDLAASHVTQVAVAHGKLLPSWSSDGKRIAYQAGGIWVVAVDASGRRRVAADGFAPAWRPGTDQLAWITLRGDLRVGDEVWAQHAIGRPAWSPDGTRLAYERSDGIYVARGRGVTVRVAAPGPEVLDAAWSHDGTRLAYSASNHVWVAPADASAPPRAVSPVSIGLGPPSWRRDDAALAFMRVGGLEITTADGATSRLARQVSLATYGRVATDPAGAGIAYSAPTGPCRSHAGIHLDEQPDDPGSGTTPLTGTCAIGGTAHADTIWGTSLGGDVIRAGAGDDVVYANNGHTDKIDCGPGRDTVYADREDWTRRCERVL